MASLSAQRPNAMRRANASDWSTWCSLPCLRRLEDFKNTPNSRPHWRRTNSTNWCSNASQPHRSEREASLEADPTIWTWMISHDHSKGI